MQTLGHMPAHVEASFYNRAGRRAAKKAERIIAGQRGPNFTKPKKKRK